MTLRQLAETIGAKLQGGDGSDGDRVVSRCAPIDEAGPDDVSFLVNPKYADGLKTSRAAAVIVGAEVETNGRAVLVAPDAYYAFRNAVVALHGFRRHPAVNAGPISPLAVVHPSAKIGAGTVVHPFAVVSEGAVVGSNCVLYPHTFIGPGVRIGDDCLLYPSVTVYDDCVIGNRVTLQAGCSIGQDGFGYATHKGAHHKIPQVGNVVIEDDVEMGAHCAIDRATVGSTVIGKGTKFSDLIAIGHGCHVGKHNLLVAQVGLAGSVDTGDYVVMGGQVGVAGHLKIGNMVRIAATAGVMHNLPDKGDYGGTPAQPLADAKRAVLYTQRLPDLFTRLKKLERELERMRARPNS
jgi:UDP-3-O-[3-hydroxymyristoyl] glucosamine N-acyltransferase